MNLLTLLLRTSKRAVVLSILAGIGGGLCGIGLIALIHAELQRARPSIGLFAWCFVGLCVVAAFARVVAQVSLVRIAQDSVAELGLRLCRQILALPLEQFERTQGSSLLAILTDDILILSNGLTGIPLLCINAPIVLACLAYVGWLSPPVLGLALAVALPSVLGYQAIAERGVRRLQQARAGQDALVGHFRSLIAGFAQLKLHGKRREAFLTRQVQAAAAEVRGNNTAGMALFAVAGGWSQVAFFGFIGLLLFGLRTLPAVDPAALGVTVLVTLYIMSPLEVVVTWLPILSRADVSMRRIRALGLSLDVQAVETIEAAAITPRTLPAPIALKDVTYSYAHGEGREPFVLGPIDLTIGAGEVVFLVGGNGSGKTTLVKLVTGLYAPQTGVVTLGVEPIAPDGWETYRELFSAAFTGGHLFDSLIGLDQLDLAERAREGLTRLELDDLVQVRHGAFSTTELSQGQRDRLVLLTLLLEDRPVYVFDEWASNQDPNFRRIFYQEILPELRARRKCLLVISHDESYFHVADRVVRLDGGRIAKLDLPAARKPLRAGHAHAEALP